MLKIIVRRSKMSKLKWLLAAFCILLLAGCGPGLRKYTIEEVTQVLYDEGLICSMDFGRIEYPTGVQTYPFKRGVLCLDDHNDNDYLGDISLYPTRSELRRVTHNLGDNISIGHFTYSKFAKGNVVITITPALSEAEAERFHRALDSLE
jgi:hypothetical protein